MFRLVLVILRETMAENNTVIHTQTRCKPQHATGTQKLLESTNLQYVFVQHKTNYVQR